MSATRGAALSRRVIQGAANVPSEQWSALTDNPYESPGWFRFNERCFPRMRFVYFCAFSGDTLRAVLPAYDRHSPLYYDSLQMVPRTARGLLRWMRFLILGSPTSFCSDVIGRGSDANGLTKLAWSYAADNGFDILSSPFRRSAPKNRMAYTAGSIVDYDLPITFTSFDGYLRSLRKSRRGEVRREMREPPSVTHVPLAGHEEVMHRLYRHTADRNDAKAEVTPAFYRGLAAALGEQARLALAGDPADPKGALLYLVSKEALWALHCGFADRDLTYFQLTFYEPIRLAAERGLKFINFRPGSDEAKRLRGCRPRHLYVSLVPTTQRGRLCLKQVREVRSAARRVAKTGDGRAGAPGRDLSFSAKVRRRMLTDRNPLLVEVQNKYTVREYARARNVRMAPLHCVVEDAAGFSLAALPEDCFIKVSHASKWNVLRRAGEFYLFADGSGQSRDRTLERLSPDDCLDRLRRWMAVTFSPEEWAYTMMRKHILVEELLAPRQGTELMDYRFYTFDGVVRAINIGCASYRARNENAFFTPDWQPVSLTVYRESLPEPLPARPEALPEMLAIASRLGRGLDFVRVDLFDTDRGVMLGEMTVYPEGGRIDSPTACPVYNQWLGRQWRLAAP